MGVIYGILMLTVFLYIGFGMEIGINDNMVAVNSIPILDELILICFVGMMLFGALKSMNDQT